jgi:hypothetical protein
MALALVTEPGSAQGAPDPFSGFLGQNTTFALARANWTGSLPPMAELSAHLASLSPLREALMATLPPPPEAAIAAPFSDDLLVALANLRAAELNEAYALLEGVGYQLLTVGELVVDKGPASVALLTAGNELIAMGYFAAAMASREQAGAARRVLTALEDKVRGERAAAEQVVPVQTGATDGPLAFDPGLIYGSWQRLETDLAGQRVTYRITRDQIVKTSSIALPNGRMSTRVETTPGAVATDLAYETAEDGQVPEQAKVRILIDKSGGGTLLLDFTYLRALGGAPGSALDILVEEDGERKAFVRIGKGS